MSAFGARSTAVGIDSTLGVQASWTSQLDPHIVNPRSTKRAQRPSVVQRTELVAGLLNADEPVVTICAPAGFGKTTLLEQWTDVDSRPFVWLALNATHNQPALFKRDLAIATSSLRIPGTGLRLLPEGAFRPGAVLPDSVEGLVSDPLGPFVLVLDNCHVLHTSWALMDQLIGSVADGSQIVLASRATLSVSRSETKLGRTVLEITARDLAFDEREARVVLGSDYTDEGAQAVFEDCEGWPAGIFLSALPPLDGLVRWRASPESPDGAATVYLRAEVLDSLDEPSRTFLTRAAILQELSGPLCDAVCKTSGAGLTLDAWQHGNVFISPLPGDAGKYRCHGMLRRVLLDDLHRREPELIPALHLRASRWFLGQDQIDNAVLHATLAGDWAFVGDLVWANLHPGGGREAVDRLREWLGPLTDDQIERCPTLIIAAAWHRMMSGDVDGARRWQGLAEARAGRDWRTGLLGSEQRCALALLHSWCGDEGLSEMCSTSSAAYDALASDSVWRPTAAVLSGISLALLDRKQEAQHRLRAGAELARALGQQAALADCLAALGCLAFDGGDQVSSQRLIDQARKIVLVERLVDNPGSAYTVSVVATGSARAGKAIDAAAMVSHGLRLTSSLAGFAPWLQIQNRLLLATASLVIGDVATARRLTRQVGDLMRRRDSGPSVSVMLENGLLKAELLLSRLPADSTFGSLPFTTAELRILHLLPTHLSFPEIGKLLFVTRHTVKTHALGIYRKLGANSRSEAVDSACALGFLAPMIVPQQLRVPGEGYVWSPAAIREDHADWVPPSEVARRSVQRAVGTMAHGREPGKWQAASGRAT